MATDVLRRIVAPTDFSECAEEAWALTQRLAEALGSEVVLVHVFVEPPIYGDPPIVTSWTVVADTQKWVSDELERWAERARTKGIEVRTAVVTGSSSQEIVRLAGE